MLSFYVYLLKKTCSSLYPWTLVSSGRCSINTHLMNGISGLGREGQLVRITGQGWLRFSTKSSHTRPKASSSEVSGREMLIMSERERLSSM